MENIEEITVDTVDSEQENLNIQTDFPDNVDLENPGEMQQVIQSPNLPEKDQIGMEMLLSEMQELRHDFEAKIQYDAMKERLFDNLHRDLQAYRDGLHFRILRPLFLDLIAMHDDLGKLMDSMAMRENEPATSHSIIEDLKIFQEMIEEILSRSGTEPFSIEGDVFLPSRQRSLKTIPTSNENQEKLIARRVRKGFTYEDKLLRHELVEVYKFTS